MTITWYGNTCIGITSRASGEEKLGVFFLHDRTTRVRAPDEKADIVFEDGTVLYEKKLPLPVGKDLDKTSSRFIISHPGEYELAGFVVHAFAVEGEKEARRTVFRVATEGVSVAHLGFVQRALLSDKELEALGNVDILIVAVGGGDAMLNPQQAAQIIQQIEPRVVVPVAFQNERNLSLLPLDRFLKEVSSEKPETMSKYTIKAKDLPQEEMQITVLEPQ